VFPWLPVPRVQRLGFILPRAESPSAFCHHLSRLSDPSAGGVLLEVSRPFNGIHGAASLGDGFALPAGLRSRVFSTPQRFLQRLVPRPCFMPQPFLSFSLQSVPLAQIVNPSRGHQLPCGYPPDARKTRRWDRIACGFTDSHARGAVAVFPRKLWTHFPRGPKTLLPARPGSPPTGSPPLASFTRFEAFLPARIRSRSTRVASRRRSLLSWASAPPATIPTRPRSLEPARARKLEHWPPPGGGSQRPRGPQPPDPGET
jgi:hypothetical protein